MTLLNNFFGKFIDIEKNRYSNLEGIRALAIIMVFNVHLLAHFAKDSYFTSNEMLLNVFNFLKSGQTGVDLFFVLSGFLIFRATGKVKNLGVFMFKRYHRLWPVVGFTGLILMSNLNYSLAEMFDNFSLLMIFTSTLANFVNWTLTYEIYFYLLIGLWFFYLQRARILQNNGVFIYGLLLILAFTFIPGHFIQEPYRFIGFFWGILLAKLHDRKAFSSGFLGIFAKYGWLIALIGLPILLSWVGNFNLASPYDPLTTKYIFFLSAQLMYFLLLASALQTSSVMTPLFSSRPMRYLGNISYSFYVVHGIWGIGHAASITKNMDGSVLKVVTTWVLGMIISIIYASILFLWLEKPYFTGRPYFSRKLTVK